MSMQYVAEWDAASLWPVPARLIQAGRAYWLWLKTKLVSLVTSLHVCIICKRMECRAVLENCNLLAKLGMVSFYNCNLVGCYGNSMPLYLTFSTFPFIKM